MAKRELNRLRSLDFQHIIVSHGSDTINDGKEKIEDLIIKHGFI
jgi:hypothetical protein